jgi:glycosyltransferase involved in cell wall biosynthesis
MDEQARRGHDVAYLFSGRQYPLARGPRLRRWERAGVAMFEVVNSPLYDHGRQPELEVAEPVIEQMFATVLDEREPEVVHVHELAGLPSSILDVADRAGVSTIVTLQDYFPLCPAFKLLDSTGQICMRREVGADCVATLASDPREPGLMVEATVLSHLMWMRGLQRVKYHWRAPVVRRVSKAVGRWEGSRRARATANGASAASFQRRRDLNVERLNRAQRVIAMSTRVAEIYEALGVSADRLCTMQLTLGHIERLVPRPKRPGHPITFATLAGFESVPKGALLLLDAMSRLSAESEAGKLRLLVFGHAEPEFAERAAHVPGIEVRGGFAPAQLDAILDEVDVGLVPSVWEEAYAYAGMEFLAKGIPVIANAIGGMTDYTRDGETGWLNRSCSADGLVAIMRDIGERPEQVAELNARLLANRDAIVMPQSRHASEMDAIYHELLARGR